MVSDKSQIPFFASLARIPNEVVDYGSSAITAWTSLLREADMTGKLIPFINRSREACEGNLAWEKAAQACLDYEASLPDRTMLFDTSSWQIMEMHGRFESRLDARAFKHLRESIANFKKVFSETRPRVGVARSTNRAHMIVVRLSRAALKEALDQLEGFPRYVMQRSVSTVFKLQSSRDGTKQLLEDYGLILEDLTSSNLDQIERENVDQYILVGSSLVEELEQYHALLAKISSSTSASSSA
jgi:hypothetical protein